MNDTWTTSGFDGFSRGTCGNAGQNLYVSRRGVLQRIHQHDFTGDGHLDLIFCNSQNHWEKPPTYVYIDPLHSSERIELPSDAARSAAVADLNGLGFVPLTWERFDLVLRRRSYFEPAFQRLVAFLAQPAFATRAAALGGYDVAEAGAVRLNR